MSARDESGPAFPAADAGLNDFGDGGAYRGLTKREWFAGMALQGLLANPSMTTDPKPDFVATELATAWADLQIKALAA